MRTDIINDFSLSSETAVFVTFLTFSRFLRNQGLRERGWDTENTRKQLIFLNILIKKDLLGEPFSENLRKWQKSDENSENTRKVSILIHDFVESTSLWPTI